MNEVQRREEVCLKAETSQKRQKVDKEASEQRFTFSPDSGVKGAGFSTMLTSVRQRSRGGGGRRMTLGSGSEVRVKRLSVYSLFSSLSTCFSVLMDSCKRHPAIQKTSGTGNIETFSSEM